MEKGIIIIIYHEFKHIKHLYSYFTSSNNLTYRLLLTQHFLCKKYILEKREKESFNVFYVFQFFTFAIVTFIFIFVVYLFKWNDIFFESINKRINLAKKLLVYGRYLSFNFIIDLRHCLNLYMKNEKSILVFILFLSFMQNFIKLKHNSNQIIFCNTYIRATSINKSKDISFYLKN